MVSTIDFPWLRTRAIFFLLLCVAAFLASNPFMKMFIKHKQVQHQANELVPSPITVDIRYLDVELTAIFVFATAQLFPLVTATMLIIMLHDVYHIFPATWARRLGLDKRLSTSTLLFQAWTLLILAIVFIAALSIHTAFVFTRAAKVIVSSGGIQVPLSTVQSYLQDLDLDQPYKDTPYIRPTAEIPWAVVPLLFPTVLVTFLAARRWRTQAAARTLEHTGA